VTHTHRWSNDTRQTNQ